MIFSMSLSSISSISTNLPGPELGVVDLVVFELEAETFSVVELEGGPDDDEVIDVCCDNLTVSEVGDSSILVSFSSIS